MAGLVPAIHVFGHVRQDVDARHKAGHDDITEPFPARTESGEVPPKTGHLMLCDTCRWTERPGFVRVRGRSREDGKDGMIPCPDCGGQGIGHCCDGICEQPEAGVQSKPAP